MRKIVAAVAAAAAAAFGAGAAFAFVGADLFRGAPETPNLTPCVKALDEAEEAMGASLLILESAQEILEYGPTPGAAAPAVSRAAMDIPARTWRNWRRGRGKRFMRISARTLCRGFGGGEFRRYSAARISLKVGLGRSAALALASSGL